MKKKIIIILFLLIGCIVTISLCYNPDYITRDGIVYQNNPDDVNVYRVKKENQSAEVKAKKLNAVGWAITIGALVVGVTILTIVLTKTSDPQPFLDAISTIPAFIAQILMVLGYREQWLHWLIIDVASIIMFIMIGNWMMVAMFFFWTVNCIYGWYKWTKSAKYE